jgi:hypothetical protein
LQAFTLDKSPADESQAALLTIIASFKSSSAHDVTASNAEPTLTAQDDSGLDEEARLVAAAVKWAHRCGV